MERKSTINILEKLRAGRITTQELKKLLAAQEQTGKDMICTVPEGKVTKIKIKTDFETVYLDYSLSGPDFNQIDIAVAKRSIDRFKHLEEGLKYVITLPAPIEVFEITRYTGPMTFTHEIEEDDFIY
jgi:hypothetical protein